jgi:hypothetical protein
MYLLFTADAATKVNATASNKKQPVPVNAEVKRTPAADDEAGSDHENEGQWVTLGNKQVCLDYLKYSLI